MEVPKYSVLAFILFALVTVTIATCGYESCNPTKPGMLNVHLVPHTHDDVGWLKTVDEYYYGANNSIQHAGVQYILDSVISELAKDPGKRFIYVEMAFFYRWWNEQDQKTQDMVKGMVNDGRLEFINGGWSMNDEACTHYNAIVDQMTDGHRFLASTFGACGVPRIGWHIDPFGHSREMVSLFSQMGMDGFFFARIDSIEEFLRLNTKKLEMVWHGNPNLGSAADLFSGVTYIGYGPPFGFCFDRGCSDPPIQDDGNLFDDNADARANLFIKLSKDQAEFFPTNNIMMTMGSDFQWENANAWYKNLDKLIKLVNAKESESGVHLLYSTPSCYVQSVNKANHTWTTKSQDFMPYADTPHAFWTGYYVSRAALKGYVRESNNILQVAKQIEVLTGMKSSTDHLKQAMGVAQHHDAVTGTEKQHVANDYARRLAIGRAKCEADITKAITLDISDRFGVKADGSKEFCEYINISICHTTETQSAFTVTVYNPIGRLVQYPIRVPVNGGTYKVMGPNGTVVTQVQDVTAATKAVRRDRGNATMELVFMAHIPAMGYTTYQVTASPSNAIRSRDDQTAKAIPAGGADMSIKNGFLQLTFDKTTGLLKSMTDLISNTTTQVSQSFYWYEASEGSKVSTQASGAYIFRPNRTEPTSLFDGSSVHLKIVNGDVVQEVQQQFSPWMSQVIRLYNGIPAAEFSWTVGPIPISDGKGKEIITRFDSNINSGKTFYTDANGRQIMERTLDHREGFFYYNTEPVAGNYYPINSRIFIKDNSSQLTVLTDRSQGGSSLKSGSVELMVHRRILKDDGRGVGEPMNETGQFGDGLIVRGSHFVSLATPKSSVMLHRTLAEQIYMAPYYYVSSGSQTPVSSSFISKTLPTNVHLLTLEQLTDSIVLLRLEHQFEIGEDSTYSKNATVSLKNLFKPFSVSGVKELTLTANRLLKDVKRLQWNVEDSSDPTPQPFKYTAVTGPSFDVKLSPMDIRTFNVTITRH